MGETSARSNEIFETAEEREDSRVERVRMPEKVDPPSSRIRTIGRNDPRRSTPRIDGAGPSILGTKD